MCLRVSKLRKEMWNKKIQNSGDWYWNIILYKKVTVIRVSNKHCDLSSCMYYLKFTFKGPEYTRNIVFLMILLQIFSNIKKLCDCFFSNWIILESMEFCLWLAIIKSYEEKGADLQITWFSRFQTSHFL